MRPRRRPQAARLRQGVALAAGALAVVVAMATAPRGTPTVQAAAPDALPPVEIAVLATARDVDAQSVDVRFEQLAGSAAPSVSRRLGTIALPREGVARGDVVRGERAVVVVADGVERRSPRARDTDFAAVLYAADEAHGVRRLVNGVLHASKPLASVDGATYVERGVAGVDVSTDEARRGLLRVDTLTIDAVDRATGATREIYPWSGYALHIAGELGGELFVYRVGPGLAEIVAVDRASGRSRVVAAVPPFARDFTVDTTTGALVMSNRDVTDAHTWVVERVDVTTGLRTRAMSTRDEAATPFALEGAGLAWSTRSGTRGSTSKTGARLFAVATPASAPAFESLRATASDGRWALTARESADGAETLSVVHLASGTSRPIPTHPGSSAGERLEPVGFVGGTRAALR